MFYCCNVAPIYLLRLNMKDMLVSDISVILYTTALLLDKHDIGCPMQLRLFRSLKSIILDRFIHLGALQTLPTIGTDYTLAGHHDILSSPLVSLSQLPEASNEEVILSGRPEDEVILSGPQEEVVTDSDFLSGVYDTVPFAGQHQVIGRFLSYSSASSKAEIRDKPEQVAYAN